MSLEPGTRLGAYEILSPLGAGGMGEVYRARDTKLSRTVAIKVLPTDLAKDAERLARFEREAQLLAALNHPNIAAIYGVEETSGLAAALVMELVEGEDLSALIARGPLPMAEALPIARQISEALEAAHEKGIVHRDLKPQNIKISPQGNVKVLDFGLAKALESGAGFSTPAEIANSPTVTFGGTREGIILGTAAYMSPEQARGAPVDKRTDIWAFGTVLYELLTGERLFAEGSVVDTLSAVMRKEIDLARLPASTPSRLRELLQRCLERNPRNRLHDIADARLELEAVAGEGPGAEAAVGRHGRAASRLGRAAGLAGALALGAIAGVVTWRTLASRAPSKAEPLAGPMRLSVVIPDHLRFQNFRITPDGRSLVLLARERAAGIEAGPMRIYVRQIASSGIRALPGTEEASVVMTSPDSQWVYFRGPTAPGADTSRIARVPLDGSAPPVTVAAWDPSWLRFSVLATEELIVTFAGSSQFVRIPSAGGPPGPPIRIDAGELRTFFTPRPTRNLVPSGSLLVNVDYYRSGRAQVGVGLLDLVTGKLRLLVEDAQDGVIVAGGRELLFGRVDALLAVDFDPQKDEVRSAPRAVLGGVRSLEEELYPAFSVSTAAGVIALLPGGRAGYHRRVVHLDVAGRLLPWSDDRRYFDGWLSVSGDGRRMALPALNSDGSLYEIWTSEVERPLLRRLPSFPGADSYDPQLSHDGSRLAYLSTGSTEQDGLYVLTIDGGTAPRRLARATALEGPWPTSWSPDGRFLLAVAGVNGQSDVVLYRPDGPLDAPAQALLATPIGEGGGMFSPDGKWILYLATESGSREVRICRFEADDRAGLSYPVSRGAVASGFRPRWRHDGRAIFYSDGDHLVSVEITTTTQVSAAPPKPVVDLAALQLTRRFDVLPDGSFLFVQKDENEGEVKQIDLILGDAAVLEARN